MSNPFQKDRRTVRPINIIGGTELWHDYVEFCSKLNQNCEDYVEKHKEKFGRQDYCYTGEYRYWVWEFEEGYRVFVSNKYGVGLEVEKEVAKDPEEVKFCCAHYCDQWDI